VHQGKVRLVRVGIKFGLVRDGIKFRLVRGNIKFVRRLSGSSPYNGNCYMIAKGRGQAY